MRDKAYRISKRIFDTCAAAGSLVVLSPLMLVIAATIRLQDGKPVIFVHRRVGRDGREIDVYKFRTMIHGAENIEETLSDAEAEEYYAEFKLEEDPRITGCGAFLRRSSLDELPQLVNILKGSMSFVGPRPLMRKEYDFYSEEEAKKLQSVMPGLTGYWQAYARNDAGYADGERQRMELYYVEHAGIGLDLRILLKTVSTVLTGRGAR